MHEANALTDAIGLVIAVSYIMQAAIGPGLTGLLNLVPVEMPDRFMRWLAIGGGGLLGGLLGVIAWQGDENVRWIAIGALAGLLAGASQRLPRRAGRLRSASTRGSCRCCPPGRDSSSSTQRS